MKFRHLLLSLLAVAAFSATSCQEEEKDLGLPEIKISQNELALDQGVGTTTLNVYATRNWTVSTTADWIAVNPAKGAAYSETTVTVTVLENESYNRTGTVKFDIGYDSKTLTIKQTGAQGEKSEGSGTVEDPYTVAGVLAFLETLGTTESENVVYVKGKVTAITEAFSAQYGNGTFTITDDGNGSSSPFTAYRVLYLGNKKWTANNPALAEGDDVIVAGKVINYNGKTPETVQGTGYVYSHNGNTAGGGGSDAGDPEGDGTLENPYNVAGIIQYTSSLASDATSDKDVYFSGVITSVGTIDTGFGNGTFYIGKTKDSETTFYCYRAMYLGNTKFTIKVGDEVVMCGKVTNYKGNTPETVQSKAYIYKLNGETGNTGGGGDEAKGTGTLTDPYNPAGAVAAVANLSWTSKTEYQTTEDVYVKGKISKIADNGTFTDGGTYGNASFYISETGEETGTQFYAFRILYLENKKFEAGQTDIKKGDEVIILGKLMNYQGNTPETVAGKAYLYSLNGATTAGGGGGGSTDITTATIAQIIAAEVSDTKLYKLTATIKTVKNTTYGNLEVEDETGTLAVQGLTSKNEVGANDKSFSSLNLAAGDKITIVGVRQAYNDTPQLGSNNLACYFVEKVSGGNTGGGGDTGNGITLSFPDDNKENNKVNGYTDTWTAIKGDYSWSIAYFNNYNWDGWSYIRAGRKNAASTASIATTKAISAKVKSVVVNYSKVNAADKIKSNKLIVATDAGFTQNVQTITATISAAGDVTYTVTTPVANAFYKLDYEFDAHSANGIIEVSKVVYTTE